MHFLKNKEKIETDGFHKTTYKISKNSFFKYWLHCLGTIHVYDKNQTKIGWQNNVPV